jgi:septal ring factor EnvC (AmiA/AmiB activator)
VALTPEDKEAMKKLAGELKEINKEREKWEKEQKESKGK